jgi:hypothetical protein
MQLFHHTNTEGFFLLPVDSGNCKTCDLPVSYGAMLSTLGNQRATHFANKKQELPMVIVSNRF